MHPSAHNHVVSTTPPAADVELRRSAEGVVVDARGEFDALTSPKLRAALDEALGETPAVLVVNLTETAFFSSAAIGVLIDADLKGGSTTSVRVVAPRAIRRTLQILGLDKHFGYYDSTQAALADGPG
ncbi:STAS domain-containing protein [Amycolatopsis sp. NPDC051372]|uniref:STAS domain-containing protein n=1 Tax=unclassified Amycolatopsis TaxID=2618356 RepID=UPI003429BE2D